MIHRMSYAPTIRLRCDLYRTWEESDSILREGELVVAVKDDGSVEIRVGNGMHTFKESPILNAASMPNDTYMYFNTGPDMLCKWKVDLINPITKSRWENICLHPEEDSISKLEEVI